MFKKSKMRWRSLTANHKIILIELFKNPLGLTLYKLSQKVQLHPKSTWRCLQKLKKLNFIQNCGRSPAIFKFNPKAKNKIKYHKVQCPKCKTECWVHEEQETKDCVNQDCVTNAGYKTKFWITPNRILDEFTIK